MLSGILRQSGLCFGRQNAVDGFCCLLASALRNEDYWVTGRTLEKVGLDGMTGPEMRQFVMEGYKD